MVNRAEKLNWSFPIFVALACFGALLWAKSDDPFRRVEFTLKIPSSNKVKGIAVLPKPILPRPVVVYLHGSGGSLMTSGTELRQLAELGMAAVCLEYDQTNQTAFDEEFQALSQFLSRQPWAITNAIAWVGTSLGAQRILSFALRHPEIQPQLLVRLSGGWVPELDAPSSIPIHCPVLLVHSERDEVFPVQDTHRLAALLRINGIAVTERILPETGHGFDANRALVIRLVAEYCNSTLTPSQPFQGVAERRIMPLLTCMIPAFGWAAFCLYRWRKSKKEASSEVRLPLNRWEKSLRWLAFALATLALVETGVHLLTPHFAVTDNTLSLGRRYLVAPQMMVDFNVLTANPILRGKPLKTLLEHVELANYNRNELINWKVDDQIYHEFVLSPIIDPVSSNELNWRRPLWESFYPRIRKENSPESAAVIVVRYLRERVTIAPHSDSTQPGVESMWKHQITDAKGFETIYVAALRSVGVGARLNNDGQAEFWTGEKWLNAPRPLASSLL